MKFAVQSLFIAVGCLLVASIGLAQDVSYFRQDYGVAGGKQALPSDFEQGAKQLWRTQLQKGHSTPCVCGDSIFLTTFASEEKELATVAIDRATGQVKWKQIVPTS